MASPTHTPQGGILIYGGLSLLFTCAIVGASYERWKARTRGSKGDAAKFWKNIFGAAIVLAASLILLVVCIEEYRDKLGQ
jgi:hypothetical protein